MLPVLFSLGRLNIYTYGVLVAAGVLLGFVVFERESRRLGIDRQRVSDLSFWAALSGFLGARLTFVLLHFGEYRGDPLRILKLWEGGLVLYGGLIPAVSVALLLMRHWDLPWRRVLDASSAGMALGFGLGRLGCFAAGCCYGRPTDLPWGVVFSDPRSLAPLGVRLHPTQLYEALFFLLAFLLIRRFRPEGRGFGFFGLLLSYSIFRFLNEFLRGDPRRIILGLSHNQWIMLGVLGFSLFMLSYLRNVEDPDIPQSGPA